MVTLPDHIHPRRHAPPAFVASCLDRELDRPATQRATPDPRLAIAWRISAGGHPVSGWSVTTAAADGSAFDRPSG